MTVLALRAPDPRVAGMKWRRYAGRQVELLVQIRAAELLDRWQANLASGAFLDLSAQRGLPTMEWYALFAAGRWDGARRVHPLGVGGPAR